MRFSFWGTFFAHRCFAPDLSNQLFRCFPRSCFAISLFRYFAGPFLFQLFHDVRRGSFTVSRSSLPRNPAISEHLAAPCSLFLLPPLSKTACPNVATDRNSSLSHRIRLFWLLERKFPKTNNRVEKKGGRKKRGSPQHVAVFRKKGSPTWRPESPPVLY